ncbi:MAG: response regulator [Pirellulales bacterium]
MPKTVLDVGNCVPDHAAIRGMLQANFGAAVLQAHGPDDTLAALAKGGIDLVLINRKLDQDYSDGIEILRLIKKEERYRRVPVMLITNYPDHQAAAVAEGAEYGFGKLELSKPETRERLSRVLNAVGG